MGQREPATGDEHVGHSDCSEVLHHIYEYLDGEMSPEDVKRVAKHLAECRPCLAEHDLDAAVKQVVKRSCPEQVAPEVVRMQVVQRITTMRFDPDC
ncbi:mycothiol system anti-sigma-R factor [Phycicoccus sp. CSK15P-2]|uniref:mycothiol system anti-sigma-R factor n=1 Tax=Phycicoccus sp. CSK15P-2 TaxID=2807627 RepID=UPI00195143B1|nr:mycothiol system anti-sigma-R factor [Phycicoccus sp. CSK15P-2]MBM6405241.1 mycothiol system anti-sigma-R factor [Phycicoccus sp. CSK15P-2]